MTAPGEAPCPFWDKGCSDPISSGPKYPGEREGLAPRSDRCIKGAAKPLCAERAQQIAADDVALNFAGTIPDPLDARISPEPLQRIVIHQPHTAVDLNSRISHPRQSL